MRMSGLTGTGVVPRLDLAEARRLLFQITLLSLVTLSPIVAAGRQDLQARVLVHGSRTRSSFLRMQVRGVRDLPG